MDKVREPLIGYMVIEDYAEDYSDWSGQITYPNPRGANLHWQNPIEMIEKSAYDELKHCYDQAIKEHDKAIEALEKCKEQRDKAYELFRERCYHIPNGMLIEKDNQEIARILEGEK